jgi:hypothetical protein
MIITDKEFNVETGEETITEREETALEKKEREKFEAEALELLTHQAAKDAARQAVLDKLGLSADEVAALLG